ncbi:hypothetical protein AWR27_14225 [Spirosoma montaniterrae]|uniref:HTH LytTR-type domain-containing protein n=2 Tax=Spirosoma montaniterrae TaxID=1178516 RepID=A0A1P9WYB2_9BACT|nr:hypothetical protein AWR27_14225 [Spirosoma montaniterrae]
MLLRWATMSSVYSLLCNGLFMTILHVVDANPNGLLKDVLLLIAKMLIAFVSVIIVGILFFGLWENIRGKTSGISPFLSREVQFFQLFFLVILCTVLCTLTFATSWYFNLSPSWRAVASTFVSFIVPAIAYYKYSQASIRQLANRVQALENTTVISNEAPLENPIRIQFKTPAPALPCHLVFLENEREMLRLLPNDLYAVQSQGNYVFMFWHEKGDKLEKTLLRAPIGQVDDILRPYTRFMRTHRSYIVNLEKIRKVEGNARGLVVRVSLLEEPVLVARSRIEAFREAIHDQPEPTHPVAA